jgi:RNA polymerase sigma-70 factor (ECF subfamily)
MPDGNESMDFENMYRANVRRVLSYALSRTNSDEAKDIVSRTFTVAWIRRQDLPAEPLPWLIGVARKHLSDLRRAAGRQEALWIRLASHAVDSDFVNHPIQSERLELREGILWALEQLRPADFEILTLSAWQGFTIQDISVALGCSKSTAGVRLHRAKSRFAKFLDQVGEKADFELDVPVPDNSKYLVKDFR